MRVVVNGETVEAREGATIAELVERLLDGSGGRGVAVALEGEVVAQSDWEATVVNPGQRLEVLTAMQGG